LFIHDVLGGCFVAHAPRNDKRLSHVFIACAILYYVDKITIWRFIPMSDKPYIAYPPTAAMPLPNSATYVSEPGKVSFGVQNFPPYYVRSLHRHNLWELIIIDGSSEGPGYVFFDGKWWRVLPGSGVFVPKGYAHSWSSGKNRFKMLWVYGGTHLRRAGNGRQAHHGGGGEERSALVGRKGITN
jgi:hypothetical protein